MKETGQLEIGDLVFAYRYHGPVNSATIGVVLRVSKQINPNTAMTEVLIFTPDGYETVAEKSCQVISKKK